MMRVPNNWIFCCFLAPFLFTGCSDDHPSADKVIAAINGADIPTQNGISLSPDYRELYVSLPIDEMDARGRQRVRIFRRTWTGRKYGAPEAVSFNSGYSDYHPVMSPDGKRIYFNSTRPKPGENREQSTLDIWFVENLGGQWSSAKFLPIINTEAQESYPAISREGRLFYNSDRIKGSGDMDIWSAAPNEYAFHAPRPVDALNSSDSENDLTISPEGTTIILNRYKADFNSIDLYQSHWKDGRWSEPKLMDEVNESDVWELTPTIGPNGQIFLYEREGIIRAMKF